MNLIQDDQGTYITHPKVQRGFSPPIPSLRINQVSGLRVREGFVEVEIDKHYDWLCSLLRTWNLLKLCFAFIP